MVTNEFNPSVWKKINPLPLQLGKVYIPSKYMIPKIWRKPDYRIDTEYHCSIHVETLASLTSVEAQRLISVCLVKPLSPHKKHPGTANYFYIEKVEAAFNYPLKKRCVLTISPDRCYLENDTSQQYNT